MRRDQPGRVRELVGVELPRVVLRLPRRVDDDRVERNVVFRIALEVGLDVALVLVDVAALPVPVRPLGQQRRERARRAQERAQPRRRRARAEQVQPQRPGGGARGDLDLVAEVELRAVADGLEPRRPAARRDRPRHRRVVALRDPALVEHVGRAVGAGVAAVGAEPRPSGPAWSTCSPWRAPSPVRRCSACPGHARPSRRTGRAPAGVAPASQRSSMTTWSGPGCVTRTSAPASRRSSGSPSSSPAITPSVHCTKWSWISPSRTRGSIGPSSRRPSRRMVTRGGVAVEFDRDHRDRIGARDRIPSGAFTGRSRVVTPMVTNLLQIRLETCSHDIHDAG